MAVRDLLIMVVMFGLLPFCFLQPWIGILVWSWIGFMNPHRLTWGFTYNMPFAQLTGGATILGFLMTKDRRSFPFTAEIWFLLLLWVVYFLSTTFAAIYPDLAWAQFVKVSKIYVMTLLIPPLFQDRVRIRALLWVMMISIGFFGLKGGVFAAATGGQYQVLGPPGSFIEGNTEVGLAFDMILPFLVYLRRDATKPWLRHLLTATFLSTIVAVLVTYSRGALLGLAAVLLLLFLRSRSKFLPALLLVIGVGLAATILPQQWADRMSTIATYKEDQSAMGRIQAWEIAVRIAQDRPLLGAGFRPFSSATSIHYLPDQPPTDADAHNIFFQVLAEHGITGLVLYLGLLGSTAFTLRRLIRGTRRRPDLEWMHRYAQLLEVSLVGYVVSGFFLSLSYFDLYYHLVAITVAMKLVYLRTAPATVPLPAPRPPLLPVLPHPLPEPRG